MVGPRLKGVPQLRFITLEYVHYHGKGIVPDTNNVLSVQDKFFLDTLVNNGVLDDDGPKYIKHTMFKYGGIDKNNPRVDVIIRNAERIHDMQFSSTIKCSAEEVQAAVKAAISGRFPQFGSLDGATFIRGDDGSMEVRFDTELVPGSSTPAVTTSTKTPTKAPAKPDGQTAMTALRALPNPSPTVVSLPGKAQDASKAPEGAGSPGSAASVSEEAPSLFSGGALPPPNSGEPAKTVSTTTSGKASSVTPEPPSAAEPGIFDAFEALNTQT